MWCSPGPLTPTLGSTRDERHLLCATCGTVVACWLSGPVQGLLLHAGLPPAPQLPLPPGLDSAPAVPYQQKPIDLFKAIFEASDSEDEADEDETDVPQKAGQPANHKPKVQAASLQPDKLRDSAEGALPALQHLMPKKYSYCVLTLPSHIW